MWDGDAFGDTFVIWGHVGFRAWPAHPGQGGEEPKVHFLGGGPPHENTISGFLGRTTGGAEAQ